MRVELVLLVRKSPEFDEQIQLIGPDDWKERTGTDFMESRLPANSERARETLELLQTGGFEFYMREERHFDVGEIRRASFLRTGPEFQMLGNILPGEVEYDWSEACETCMRTPLQVGSLALDHDRLDDEPAILGPRGELLVNEQIATRMIKDGITGCILREVRPGPDTPEPETPYFQVIVTREAPPAFSPPTRFLTTDDRCAECGQGGLFLDSSLYYDINEEELGDVNHTREFFGQGARISPELLLSARFYNLLLACGAHLEEPEPVLFV